MSSVANLPPSATDNTTTYFNNFSESVASVTPNENSAIVAYFETVTGDITSAKVLASSVMQTAYQQNLKPMEILDQFRSMNPGDLNAFLVLFLNLNRAPTSLIGINNQTESSFYTIRTILA
jgi:hypothetical protein